MFPSKESRLDAIESQPSLNRPRFVRVKFLVLSFAVLYAISHWFAAPYFYLLSEAEDQCPQPEGLSPSQNGDVWEKVNQLFDASDFHDKAVNWLGDAIRIPTETYDGMDPVGDDERWQTRAPFVEWLPKAFPLVHETFKKTTVNTYGLLYEWKGSDSSLKPLLLMAHYDVVPVNPDTSDTWEHPPYSGHFDGERIWGRGSSDDKSGVIGILLSLEVLIEQGWKPARTVILSFGFDEEAGGAYGAQYLATALEEKYGKNSIALIVDEGSGILRQYGATTAIVAVGEKGAANLKIDLRSPGGHSSIPPVHTTIGLLSQLIVDLEKNPYPVHLVPGQPTYETALCLGAHAPEIPRPIKKALALSGKSKHARKIAETFLFKTRSFEQLTGTTQAVDIISGGVKSNALPELASALVNHRIATESSVAETRARDTKLIKHIAHKLRLNLTAFGEELNHPHTCHAAIGSVELKQDAFGALEPAHNAPSSGKPYQLLAGSIKATYAKHRANDVDSNDIVVAPGIMSGNTDTKYFWNLSEHIFRYNHQHLGETDGLGAGIHTVNEHITLSGFLEQIRFFTTVILNADEIDLD